MTRVRYHLLDVFTDVAFAGNPLAVFVDPPEMDDEQMQTLAREFNLSETVFVRSPEPGAEHWVIHQGVEMGRPSTISVALERRGNEATAVTIGGHAVVVGQGEIELPVGR